MIFKTIRQSLEDVYIAGRKINELNNLKLNATNVTAYATALKGLNARQAELVLSTQGLTLAQKQAILSQAEANLIAKKESASLLAGIGAKIKSAGTALKGLGTGILTIAQAHPVIAGITAALALCGGAALANKIKQEKAAKAINEAYEEAKNTIDEINNTYSTHSSQVKEISKEYAELAQGVNLLTNENKNLSTEKYERFLELSSQLSKLFPSLTKNFDENGVAILDLFGDVDTIVGSLDDLIERQRVLANQEIMKQMPDLFAGYSNNVADLEKQKENAKKTKDEIQKAYDVLKSWDGSTVWWFNGGQVVKGADNVIRHLSDYTNALDVLGIKYKQVAVDLDNDLYHNNDGYNIEADYKKYGNELHDIYVSAFNKASDDAKYAEQQFEAEKSSINQYLNTWLQTEFSYNQIEDSGLQKAIQDTLFNFDWSSLPEGIDKNDWDEISEYLRRNILFSINNINFSDVSKALADIYSGSLNSGELLDAIAKVQEYFGSEHPISVTLQAKVDDTQPLINNVKEKLQDDFDNKVGELTLEELHIAAEQIEVPEGTLLSWDELIAKIKEVQSSTLNIETSISFDQAWADSFTSENDAVKELGNSLLDLAEKGRLTTETFNQEDSTNYFKNLGISAEEAVAKVNQLVDESQQLSSMSGNISKISEALGTKRDNKFVSADTLSGFDAEIRGLESWDHFQEVLGNVNSSYNDCRKAANTLASEWLNNSDFLAQLTEQNREYYASQLKAMGIENYDEILTYAYQLTTAKEALTQAGFDLSAATFDEVQALISEGEYSALAQQQIWNLVLAKQISEGLTLNTAADCENLAALAQNAGVTGEAVTLLTHLMNLYNNMANGVYGNNQHAVENARKEAERLKSQIDSLLSKSIKETPVLKPRLKPSPAVKSISDDAEAAAEEAKRAAEEAARSAEETLDGFLSRQETALNAGRISFQEYSDTVSSYLQAAFASGSLSAQKYWSALQSFLTVKKDSYDAAVSAVTERIDREINTLRDRQDSIAAGYQSQIDSLEKQKELLQGANEERKRQLDLQKALYDQERAHQQRTILQYSESQGIHYIQDAQALRDAGTQVEDARLQIKTEELEQAVTDLEEARDREKASLDHMILNLEHYRDQWNQISTAYEEAQENQLAAMILGQNWEADILGMRTDVLAAFTDNYIRLQQQIADAAWESANAQIAAQTEAAKGTDGTKGTAQAQIKNLAEGLRHTEGKAPADQAALTQETVITRGGLTLTPVQPGEEMYELMQKYNTYLESIDGNLEKMLPSTAYEQGGLVQEDIGRVTGITIANSKKIQPLVNQNFHISLPNVTNSTSAEALLNDLQSIALKKYQVNW